MPALPRSLSVPAFADPPRWDASVTEPVPYPIGCEKADLMPAKVSDKWPGSEEPLPVGLVIPEMSCCNSVPVGFAAADVVVCAETET